MITHYGLFWSKRAVFWKGARGNPGALLGKIDRKGETGETIDFRKFKGVYCLYNDNHLVYVGQAGIYTTTGDGSTLFGRLRGHRRDHLADVWNQFSWFGVKDVPEGISGKDALTQLEAICIAITNPGFNRQSGAFTGAEQVEQVAHDDALGDIDTKLDRIMDELQALKAGSVSKTSDKGKKGRVSKYAGKTIIAKVDENPRREGTNGYYSMQIILNHRDGISYEAFIEKGGRGTDLKWDIDHDHVKLI